MAMLFVESKLIGWLSYNGGTINVFSNGEVHARHGEYGGWRKFKTIGAGKCYITKRNNTQRRLRFVGVIS